MSQQSYRQTKRAGSLLGLDETPERESNEKSSKSLLTPPETDPGEETHASRSGTSPPSTNPPSYFDYGQPGYRESLPRDRTPSSRAPGFHIGPRPRVQRPSYTPLLEPRRPSSYRPHRQYAQRDLSHQASQLGNDSHEIDVKELVPGPAIGNGDAQQNYAQGHIVLPAGRPLLSFGPPIASQQPSEFSSPIPTASDLAASQFGGQTRASRTTSSRGPESVPGRASHPSPYKQQVPDEPFRQGGYHGTVVATSAATYLARREAELWNTRAHERQTNRNLHATNEPPHYLTKSHTGQGDRPSTARGQYERPVHSPETKSGISSNPSDVQNASKRPRSGNSSPTDQPATQRPRTSVTESSRSTQSPPQGVGEAAVPQIHTNAAPSASFSIATISRRTIVAASSTPDPAARTSPPRMVDLPRPSNVTPPNPHQTRSTPRPNASNSGHHRSGLATTQRPSPSTNASLSNGRETNIRQTSTSTPPIPRSSSIASASPTPRNRTSGRNGSPSTSLSSRPNSHRNASNDRRSSTPASSESQPSTTSQAHATDRGTPPVWDEGFDYRSLSIHQRTTYRPGHSRYLIAALRSGPQGQGGILNADPSRFYRENNPEDPRIERIMDGLHVTRDEAIGIILGQEEVRKQQVKEKKSAAQKETAEATIAQASQDEHTTPQKRPRTEQRFRAEMARPRRRRPRTERMYREEMARLHPPSNDAQNGHRRIASQPSLVTRPTERYRPRSHTVAGPNQRTANGQHREHDENSKTNKGKKREERHYRCHLPPDPKILLQHPLRFLTRPPVTHARLDETSSLPPKSLDRYDLTHQNPGFRTVAQYDTLCKTLHQDYKRTIPSAPAYRDPSLPISTDYYLLGTPITHSQRDVASTKAKHILRVALSLLLVCGWLGGAGLGSGGVAAAAVGLAVFVVWLLLL